jgi:hypothetical protein
MKTLVKYLLWLPLFGLFACSGENILVTAEPTPVPFGAAQGTILQTSPTPSSSAQGANQGSLPGVEGPAAVNLQIPFSSAALGFDSASKLSIKVYNCTNTPTAADSSIKACVPGSKPIYSADLPVQEIADPLQMGLPGVKVGETVEFSGSGHDRGNCNPITAAPQRVKITESPLLWKELKWQTTDKTCILKLKLSGKVTDTSQQPLALVQIEARSRDSNTAYAQNTETQVDGSYSLTDVPQGIPIEIKVSKRGYLTKTFSASFLPTNFNQTEVKDLDFALSDPN